MKGKNANELSQLIVELTSQNRSVLTINQQQCFMFAIQHHNSYNHATAGHIQLKITQNGKIDLHSTVI